MNKITTAGLIAISLVALTMLAAPAEAGPYDVDPWCWSCKQNSDAEQRRRVCQNAINRHNTLVEIYNAKFRYQGKQVQQNALLDIRDAKRDIQRWCR